MVFKVVMDSGRIEDVNIQKLETGIFVLRREVPKFEKTKKAP